VESERGDLRLGEDLVWGAGAAARSENRESPQWGAEGFNLRRSSRGRGGSSRAGRGAGREALRSQHGFKAGAVLGQEGAKKLNPVLFVPMGHPERRPQNTLRGVWG